MYNHCHKHNTNMSRNGDNVEMATASSDIKSSVQTKTLEMDKGTLSHWDIMWLMWDLTVSSGVRDRVDCWSLLMSVLI